MAHLFLRGVELDAGVIGWRESELFSSDAFKRDDPDVGVAFPGTGAVDRFPKFDVFLPGGGGGFGGGRQRN